MVTQRVTEKTQRTTEFCWFLKGEKNFWLCSGRRVFGCKEGHRVGAEGHRDFFIVKKAEKLVLSLLKDRELIS